jgi:hypothetical protein
LRERREGRSITRHPICSRVRFLDTAAAVIATAARARPASAQNATKNDVLVAAAPAPDMGTILYARSQNAFTKAGINLQLQSDRS